MDRTAGCRSIGGGGGWLRHRIARDIHHRHGIAVQSRAVAPGSRAAGRRQSRANRSTSAAKGARIPIRRGIAGQSRADAPWSRAGALRSRAVADHPRAAAPWSASPRFDSSADRSESSAPIATADLAANLAPMAWRSIATNDKPDCKLEPLGPDSGLVARPSRPRRRRPRRACGAQHLRRRSRGVLAVAGDAGGQAETQPANRQPDPGPAGGARSGRHRTPPLGQWRASQLPLQAGADRVERDAGWCRVGHPC